jgi:hypothetical protein
VNRFFVAAVLLVLAAYGLVVALDAGAERVQVSLTCDQWRAGAAVPPVVEAMCRREALQRLY